jgi:ribose transport system permease protein
MDTMERISLVVVFGLTVALFGILRPHVFLTLNNFSSMFAGSATLTILALGLIVILRAGDFDLSIAGNAVVCSVMLGILTVEDKVPLLWSMIIVVLIGMVIGVINATIILFLRVDSFITTLGMGTVLAGLALWFSGSATIVGTPQSLTNWTVVFRFWGMAYEFYYAIALMIILWYLFRYTAVGRRVLFVGKNREVARLSGVRVNRIRFGAFVVGGFIAAVAGIVYTGAQQSADPQSGLSFLLPAYAAAFLGATCIDPGDFNPLGTLVAVYFLVTGVNGLAILGAASSIQQIFYGAALIVSVVGSQYVARRKARAKLDVG